MLKPRLLFPSTLLALAFAVAPLRSADACSGPLCYGGYYLPVNGTVPASLPGILFNPRLGGTGTIDDATVSLFRVENGSQVPVDVTTTIVGADILVTPVAPLAPDADYALEGSDLCVSDLTKASFHTGAAAALPASLGTLTASPQRVDSLEVWTVSGSCTSQVTAAQIDVNIAFADEAAPWEATMAYQTLVDGQPWSGPASGPANRWGASYALLFATCASTDDGADKGLAEGQHTVEMTATIPGSTTTLKTESITVTLTCGPGGPGGAGGGAGSVDDEGPDVKTGCSIGGTGAGGVWAIFGAAAVIAMAGRRRRARASR